MYTLSGEVYLHTDIGTGTGTGTGTSTGTGTDKGSGTGIDIGLGIDIATSTAMAYLSPQRCSAVVVSWLIVFDNSLELNHSTK